MVGHSEVVPKQLPPGRQAPANTGRTGLPTRSRADKRLIGKWPGGSDEDFDRTPYLTPQSHSERNSSTERTLSCAPSDCDSPPEPSQTSISSNSVPVPAVMSGTSDITRTYSKEGGGRRGLRLPRLRPALPAPRQHHMAAGSRRQQHRAQPDRQIR